MALSLRPSAPFESDVRSFGRLFGLRCEWHVHSFGSSLVDPPHSNRFPVGRMEFTRLSTLWTRFGISSLRLALDHEAAGRALLGSESCCPARWVCTPCGTPVKVRSPAHFGDFCTGHFQPARRSWPLGGSRLLLLGVTFWTLPLESALFARPTTSIDDRSSVGTWSALDPRSSLSRVARRLFPGTPLLVRFGSWTIGLRLESPKDSSGHLGGQEMGD